MTLNAVKHVAHWEQTLREKLGDAWRVRCVESTGSTMDEARREIPRGGEVSRRWLVLSRIQRRGRGRVGRTWYSAPGAILGTFAFAYDGPPQKLAGLPLMVGVVVADLCESLGARVRLKWPNDIMGDEGTKLGGLLIENCPGKAVLIGLGLNLDGTPDLPPKVASKVTSVRALGGELKTPAEFAALLAPELDRAFEIFLKQGFKLFRQRWERRALWIGEQVSVDLGDETIVGKLVSVDSSGALLVEQDKEIRTVLAGDVLRLRGAVGEKIVSESPLTEKAQSEEIA